jgi:hypothetical protein
MSAIFRFCPGKKEKEKVNQFCIGSKQRAEEDHFKKLKESFIIIDFFFFFLRFK